MTFTKEEQIQAVYDLKAGYTLGHADIAILKGLARMALAGMEAEPVAYMYKDKLHADARFSPYTRFGNWSQEDINEYEITEIPLYTAPQPLTSSERADLENYRNAQQVVPLIPDECVDKQAVCWMRSRSLSANYRDGWNACRAAMLQGAEPVTTAYKLPPHVYRELVNSLRDTAVKYQGCQQLREQISETLSAVITHTPHCGNSQVIPDGWVMVPVEPTHEMLEAGDEQFGTYDVYRRMIAAAPQQEVKP